VKISGFVVQTNSVSLERLVQYQEEGILGNIYVQVEHNVQSGIDRNHEVFPVWKAALPGKVFAWLWGTADAAHDRDRMLAIDENLDPDGWCFNDEAETQFKDRSAVYEAGLGKPMVVSPAGWPAVTPIDFRHAAQYGLTVEFQGYNLEGVNDKTPHYLVNECFQISKLITADPSHPIAWWYRIFFDNLLGPKGKIVRRWAWAQVQRHENGWAVLTEGRNRWWTRVEDRDGYGHFLTDRIVVNRSSTRKVGRVFGIAAYPKIAYSLSVERPHTAAGLKALAAGGRVQGASLRPATLYTLDNASDEVFRALASLN
jgi:hypothetical protein